MRDGGGAKIARAAAVSVFLSLGANVGARRASIERALARLERSGVSIERRSSWYETEPTDLEGQPWFVNGVVEARTHLPPGDLLCTCKRIEADLGRTSGVRFGPRPIDIDILLYGNETIETEDLVVPHPRMRQRRFVLVPLAEIAPQLTDPRDGARFNDVLDRLDEGKQVVRLASTES